ncbi:MAG: hypothetical protein IJS70_03560 [Bacteroidales bacterium]|nr:hypothetical protein [Bacteroidales bacterium]MBQ7458228.1 hypothetical protein [Bacteroidales bacterium]
MNQRLFACTIFFSALVLLAVSCVESSQYEANTEITGGTGHPNGGSGEGGGEEEPDVPSPGGIVIPQSNADAVEYSKLVDPLADAGQFFIPEPEFTPAAYWNLSYNGNYGSRNTVRKQNGTESNKFVGLQHYLLFQSLAGIVNKACIEGRSNIAIWTEMSGTGYSAEKAALDAVCKGEIGVQNVYELLTKEYQPWNGINPTVKHLVKGYVLTDVVGNPESANAAAVAAHIYDAIIVDKTDESLIKALGFNKLYDCSSMSVAQAFNEFKDKCNNTALVLMPVSTGEWRDYVIANRLFVMNLNKKYASGAAENAALFSHVLDWLKPCSQVLGWEQGCGEDVFVNRVSKHGHMVLAADWSYNHTITSRMYRSRQPSDIVATINPRNIDYNLKKNFISYFLTDGDNYQFIITDNFESNYYCLNSAASTKCAFEIGTQSLIQLAPTRFTRLVQKQPSPQCTIMETFGGGYYYVDTFSTEGEAAANRSANLKTLAERTAAHMRQHGIKVLHVMAQDLSSNKTKEALQAFVDANDQLEGITAVQYSPYIGGGGEIIWLKNKAGYDIPCITAKYMLWADLNFTPDIVTSEMMQRESPPSFSAVCLHAWSNFGGRISTDVAAMCEQRLNSSFKAVSIQELIWRVRMAHDKDQTIEYLKTIK